MKNLFVPFTFILFGLLFFVSCAKQEYLSKAPAVDERDQLVGEYTFKLLNHSSYMERDTTFRSGSGGVIHERMVEVFKNYTSRGKVVKSDSAHQILVYWGHDTIPLSQDYSPTPMSKLDWGYRVPDKLFFYEPYVNTGSLGFGITPFGNYSWIVEGKKIK